MRITNPRYYAGGQVGAVLEKIFAAVDIVVTSRETDDAEAQSVEEQQAQVVGMLPEGVTQDHLHFLRNDPALAPFSSSSVRSALTAGDASTALSMVPEALHAFVQEQRLYSV